MSPTPRVVVFDVNETLSDMSPLAARFVDVGASASLAQVWFASVLRDGFALTAAGESHPFKDVAEELLRVLLPSPAPRRSLEDAVGHVMAGFSGLQTHPDVVPGVYRLHENGVRLVTLTNGATAVAEQLLSAAGIRDFFEQLLSVEDAGAWKPARQAYEYAARACDVPPADLLMVAVHPWDIDGAARAGCQTAWVNRSAAHYPSVFTSPTHTVTSIEELAELVG